MRKALSVVLSLAMILTLTVGMFSFASFAEEAVPNKISQVTIVISGSNVVLKDNDLTWDGGAKGRIVFDPENSKVTLTDVSGVSNVYCGTYDEAGCNSHVTLEVKGTNKIISEGQQSLLSYGSMTIIGDGSLELSGTGYVLSCYAGDSLLIRDKVKLDVTATSTFMPVVVNQRDDAKTATCTLQDDVELTVKGPASGLTIYGSQANFIMKDNAKANLDGAPGLLLISEKVAPEGSTQGNLFDISGNAQLKASSSSAAISTWGKVDNVKNVMKISGNASVEAVSSGNALFFDSGTSGSTFEMTVADSASVALQTTSKMKDAVVCNIVIDEAKEPVFNLPADAVIKTGKDADSATVVASFAEATGKYISIAPKAPVVNPGNPSNPSTPSNPGTSDLSVALISAVSVLAVMAAAAVVIRKRVHG